MSKTKCNECGKIIIPGNTNGLPNGIGFILEDGSIYNVCRECIMKKGREVQDAEGKK